MAAAMTPGSGVEEITLPLDGLKVVECASSVAGPLCARILSDLGAHVVKVEPPRGDPVRDWGPFPDAEHDPEASGWFHYVNAGKRGVVVDPGQLADRRRLESLLAEADVLVEGLGAEELAEWGLTGRDLLEQHPHLVVASVSPYGRSGPWAEAPGTELTAVAASSLPLGLGDPARQPLQLPFGQAEIQTALHATAATLVALRERDRSGRGQVVDVAVAQVMAYCVGGAHLLSVQRGGGWGRGVRPQPDVYPTGIFECADGHVCIASQTPKQWVKLLSAMGDPEWAADARDAMALRDDPGPVDGHLRSWLRTRTRAELTQLAEVNGLTMGVVLTVDELLAEGHLRERDVWVELAVGGRSVKVPRPPFTPVASAARIGRGGPRLGGDASFAGLAPRPALPASSEDTPERRPPLEGIRVLDFTWNWAGPMATQLLADLGADVIRVETARRQDLMRFIPGLAWFFSHNNRSKRSIAVDVARPEGASLVRDLARHVDVVVDNFTPGVMERNGLGHEALRAMKRDIITVSLTMAGSIGPRRGMRGFASIGTSFAGLETLVGYEDGTVTSLMPFALGDASLAIQGALGVLAALRRRDRDGRDQRVEVSMVEAALMGMAEPLLEAQLEGHHPGPVGNRHPAYVPHGLFRCAGDDRWVALAVRHQRDWSALCGVLGSEGWTADPTFLTVEGRRRRRTEIDDAVSAWCARLSRDDAVAALRDAGVPAAPLLEIGERDAHPSFAHRGLVLDHPGGVADCRIYATPWLLGATPAAVRRPAPPLGAHTTEVLNELLGLSQAEVAALAKAGVVG